MTPIYKKSLGTQVTTMLEQELQVTSFTSDAVSEKVVVCYDIVLLAPNGAIANKLSTGSYEVVNRVATLDEAGEIDVAADMAFDALRNSEVGKAIAGMIAGKINAMFP